MEKQRTFAISDSVLTPKIFDSGIDSDGLFYFEMEYINGVSGAEFLLRSDADDLVWLFEILSNHIETSSDSENVNIKQQVVDKAKNYDGFPLALMDKVDWSVRSGRCHGDLTLENIIVRQGKIYLIDFLDSFVEVPAIDRSKILQDAFFGWSFRGLGIIPYQKLLFLKQKFSSPLHDILLLLHLHRILPYADSHTEEMVKRWIQKMQNRL